MKQYLFAIITSLLTIFLASCSSDYRSALPADSTALISIDPNDKEVASRLSLVNDLLHISDPEKCGIDFHEKLYLFETTDGSLGLCAKVADDQQLRTLFKNLEKSGNAKEGPERQKCNFFTVADKWVLGYTNASLLVMGPIVPSAQGETMNRMVRLLNQDDDDSILASQMFQKLDSLTSPLGLVAQASALPENFASVLTIGLPKEADASQCVIAANIDIVGQTLYMDSQPMSFNASINRELQKAYSAFRPITQTYLQSLSDKAIMGFFANFDGRKILPMLQQSKTLWTLLAGVNQAIDMNAIINSIDGDMLLSVPSYGPNGLQLSLAAQLSSTAFLNDVDYWKQSVPQGASITDWQKNAYCYSGDGMRYYFGVTADTKPQFYSGSSEADALASIEKCSQPLDTELLKSFDGKRIVVIVSLASLLPEGGGMGTLMLPQLIKLKKIIYTVK